METDKKDLKKMFPHLFEELEGGQNKISIDAVRKDPIAAEKAMANGQEILPVADKFRHYTPDVIDFIRRCDTEKQAEEIITYMEKRGELTETKACELKNQLKTKGVRSFGSKKEDNYYFKEGGIC